MKALVLSSSPRRNGNSALLAGAVRDGLLEAGHDVKFAYADDILSSFLRDCRQCRKSEGECAIEDGFDRLFSSAFCRLKASSPRPRSTGTACRPSSRPSSTACSVTSPRPIHARPWSGAMKGKRIGLVLASEETFPMVSGGIITRCRSIRATRTRPSSAPSTATAIPAATSPRTLTIRSARRADLAANSSPVMQPTTRSTRHVRPRVGLAHFLLTGTSRIQTLWVLQPSAK